MDAVEADVLIDAERVLIGLQLLGHRNPHVEAGRPGRDDAVPGEGIEGFVNREQHLVVRRTGEVEFVDVETFHAAAVSHRLMQWVDTNEIQKVIVATPLVVSW